MDSRKKVMLHKVSEKDGNIHFITNHLKSSEEIKHLLIEENKKKKKVVHKSLNKGMTRKTVKRVSKVMCIFFII